MKVIILFIMAFLLSACGGGSDSSDSNAPQLESINTNIELTTLTFTYNESLSAVEPAMSDFQITQNGVSLTSSFIAINDNTVIVTISKLSTGALQIVYTPGQNPIKDQAGNEAAGFTQMVVSDGYIRDAEVYADTNNNGSSDQSELIKGLTTDAQGQLLIDDEYRDYPIIIKGGINVDTGAVNLLELTAPAGYSVINPLSTLVQKIIASDNSQAVDQAEAKIIQALGITLTGDKSLSNYDPISDLSEHAIANRVATTQIATLTAVAATADTQDDSGALNIQASVWSNITELVNTTAEEIKLDANMVADILSVDQNIQYPVDIDAATTAVVDLEAIKENSASVTVEEAMAEVIQAQAKAIDKNSPAAPKLELSADSDTGTSDSVALTNDTNPSVKLSFDTKSTDGTAVIVGDLIELLDDGVTIYSHELQQSDIDNGYYTADLTDLTDGSELSATITDMGGNTSNESTSTIIDTLPPVITSAQNSSISASEVNPVIYTAAVDNYFDKIGEVSFSIKDTTLYLTPGKSSISIPDLLSSTQHVYVSSSVKSVDGSQEAITITYNAEDATTTGLGLRVYFDSSTLSSPDISNIFSSELIARGEIIFDSENLDSDASTDQYINFAWASLFGEWPGSAPIVLANITFDIAEGTLGTSAINFTTSSNPAGFEFDGQNHELAITSESATAESKLTIDPETGEVVLVGELDPAVQSEYSFTITATDLAGNSSEPYAVTLSVNKIAESIKLDDTVNKENSDESIKIMLNDENQFSGEADYFHSHFIKMYTTGAGQLSIEISPDDNKSDIDCGLTTSIGTNMFFENNFIKDDNNFDIKNDLKTSDCMLTAYFSDDREFYLIVDVADETVSKVPFNVKYYFTNPGESLSIYLNDEKEIIGNADYFNTDFIKMNTVGPGQLNIEISPDDSKSDIDCGLTASIGPEVFSSENHITDDTNSIVMNDSEMIDCRLTAYFSTDRNFYLYVDIADESKFTVPYSLKYSFSSLTESLDVKPGGEGEISGIADYFNSNFIKMNTNGPGQLIIEILPDDNESDIDCGLTSSIGPSQFNLNDFIFDDSNAKVMNNLDDSKCTLSANFMNDQEFYLFIDIADSGILVPYTLKYSFTESLEIPYDPFMEELESIIYNVCTPLDGASLYSQESPSVYLGIFADENSTESIFNSSGNYGREDSNLSVMNPNGRYGSPDGVYSSGNESSVLPPKIYSGTGDFIGYFTVNTYSHSPAFNPFSVYSDCAMVAFPWSLP
jgi:hypothetical protein